MVFLFHLRHRYIPKVPFSGFRYRNTHLEAPHRFGIANRCPRPVPAHAVGNSCDFLPQIEYFFTARRMDQRHRLPQHLCLDRDRQPFHKPPLRCLCDPCAAFRGRRQGIIPPFAVINVGEPQVASFYRPSLIGADHLVCAILVRNVNLRDQLPFTSIVFSSSGSLNRTALCTQPFPSRIDSIPPSDTCSVTS